MKEFSGDPEFPIWLIGDSPPENWVDKLDFPLDAKHPARHNVWTSILDSLQAQLLPRLKKEQIIRELQSGLRIIMMGVELVMELAWEL